MTTYQRADIKIKQGKYLERRDELLKVFNKKSLDKKDAYSRQLLARLILISGNLSKNKEMLKKDVKLFSDVNNPEFGSGNYIDFLFVMHWANAILGKTSWFRGRKQLMTGKFY